MVVVSQAVSSIAPANSILSGKKLSKVYGQGPSAVWALRDVDIQFEPGELVVLLGPSGSGKSTLLNILGGLDRPTSGDVFFDGNRLDTEDDGAMTRYRRDAIGFVFQFYNLLAGLTAEENVGLVTEIAHNPMKPSDALSLVGLKERTHHFPAELSGGEQQRVAIARAIAKRPKILLCDEPTGALDSKTGTLVLEAIRQVNHELGTTTALITHNVTIADMADRVISMADGAIVDIRCNESPASPQDLKW